MSDFDKRLDELQTRLENLLKSQRDFQREISEVRYEMNVLRTNLQNGKTPLDNEVAEKPPTKDYVPPAPKTSQEKQQKQTNSANYQKTPPKSEPVFSDFSKTKAQKSEKSNIEKFIGENLISKIGIIILVIGVAIGAKYAIDNNLISPLMRIVLGYAMGIGLVGLAIRLKPKYLNFSAVLLSGGMAIMYFITFFAHSLYALINQPTAFVLMLIFTVFAVASALNFNRQVIAHIGLVGAYAIPFLLSDDSGNYAFLFGYIAIINIGILAISVLRYWKPIFYSSYIVTWLTFYGWYLLRYSADSHFSLAFFFLTVFFLIFYLTFIAYKLVSKENLQFENVSLVTANAFIYYGLGYSILNSREGFENLSGMFTMANAAIHFAFAFTISRLKLAAQDLVYLTAALVLTFITIAVPVQLDGNFITLIWSAEAAILFWIGRTKQIPLFENYSYPLMLLALGSLFLDWITIYSDYLNTDEKLYPIFNSYFAVGIFFIAAFALIWKINRNKKFTATLTKELSDIFSFILPAILLLTIYNVFRMEIGNYFSYGFLQNSAENPGAKSYLSSSSYQYNVLWQTNYTMIFLAILSFVNIKKIKNAVLGFANLVSNGLTAGFFITVGLIVLGELRRNYLSANGFNASGGNIFDLLIRYICYAFFALMIFASYKYTKQKFISDKISAETLTILFDFALYFSALVIASVELLTWMDIFGFNESTKLGLSILWGVFALFLIILGIVNKKTHLRIFAISLFAITLVKLFVYDIADLDTISKTIVFVSLGILLLIISFLYTKYKNLIFEE